MKKTMTRVQQAYNTKPHTDDEKALFASQNSPRNDCNLAERKIKQSITMQNSNILYLYILIDQYGLPDID